MGNNQTDFDEVDWTTLALFQNKILSQGWALKDTRYSRNPCLHIIKSHLSLEQSQDCGAHFIAEWNGSAWWISSSPMTSAEYSLTTMAGLVKLLVNCKDEVDQGDGIYRR